MADTNDTMSRTQLAAALDSLRRELAAEKARAQALACEVEDRQLADDARAAHLTETQRELEASLLRYADLYDHAPIGYVTLDDNGAIHQINLTALAMLHVGREQAVGMPILRFVQHQDRRRVLNHVWRCRRATGQVATECTLLTRSGGTIPAQLISRPATDAQGPMAGHRIFRTAIIDLTDRQRTEAERRKLTAVVQASDDAIVAIDSVGRIDGWNRGAQRLTGYEAGVVIGKPLGILLAEEAQGDWRSLIEHLNRGESSQHVETIWHRRDGQQVEVSMTISPILDVHEQVIGGSVVARDLTERRQSEARQRELHQRLAHRAEQLRQLAAELTRTERRERDRLAHVLHDNLQQLLVASKLQVEIARRDSTDAATTRQALQKIDDMLDESIRLTRNLTAELSPPMLHEAGLGPALDWLKHWMAKTHGLHVAVSVSDDANPVDRDARDLMFETIRELLFNVVKHAHTSEAHVTLEQDSEGMVRAMVADRGRGFNPDAEHCHRNGGFGLFSAAERLELMGGHLKIDSRPGEGTKIVVTVPAAE